MKPYIFLVFLLSLFSQNIIPSSKAEPALPSKLSLKEAHKQLLQELNPSKNPYELGLQENKKFKAIRGLLEQHPQLSNMRMSIWRGNTPPLIAAIRAYQDPKLSDTHETIIDILLQHGSDPNGLEFLKSLAILPGDQGIRASNSPLIAACSDPELEKAPIVYALIEAKSLVNFQGDYGDTALHRACANQHYGAISRLIEAKANPKIINDSGKAPLDLLRKAHKENVQRFNTFATRLEQAAK